MKKNFLLNIANHKHISLRLLPLFMYYDSLSIQEKKNGRYEFDK